MAAGEDSSSSGLSLEGIDDVEDFIWGNQGDSASMSLGRFSHLYDLMDMGNKAFRENHFEEGKTFTCNAMITDILTKVDWFYNACPDCMQTIHRSGDQWSCPTDGKKASPRWLYRLVVVISDGTEKMPVTMFDEAVKTVVGTSCADLVISDSCSATLEIPPVLQSMKGKVRKFHLRAQRDTYSKATRCTVNKVTDTDADLFEFTSLVDVPPPPTPQSPPDPASNLSPTPPLLDQPGFDGARAGAKLLKPKRLLFDPKAYRRNIPARRIARSGTF